MHLQYKRNKRHENVAIIEILLFYRAAQRIFRKRFKLYSGVLYFCFWRKNGSKSINSALLNHSNIPGFIVETAFISNPEERLALGKDEFKEQIAEAIAEGAEKYLIQSGKVLAPEHDNNDNNAKDK
ncbi:MAG: hypothetical protein GX115_06490 [Ruminiclostridium sp.]|nr:hypothetical protein [Ruminiclostridium sp.]